MVVSFALQLLRSIVVMCAMPLDFDALYLFHSRLRKLAMCIALLATQQLLVHASVQAYPPPPGASVIAFALPRCFSKSSSHGSMDTS